MQHDAGVISFKAQFCELSFFFFFLKLLIAFSMHCVSQVLITVFKVEGWFSPRASPPLCVRLCLSAETLSPGLNHLISHVGARPPLIEWPSV